MHIHQGPLNPAFFITLLNWCKSVTRMGSPGKGDSIQKTSQFGSNGYGAVNTPWFIPRCRAVTLRLERRSWCCHISLI